MLVMFYVLTKKFIAFLCPLHTWCAIETLYQTYMLVYTFHTCSYYAICSSRIRLL